MTRRPMPVAMPAMVRGLMLCFEELIVDSEGSLDEIAEAAVVDIEGPVGRDQEETTA
jgi:hypothetical protein